MRILNFPLLVEKSMLYHSIIFPVILYLGPIDPLETDDNSEAEQEDDTIKDTSEEKTKEEKRITR